MQLQNRRIIRMKYNMSFFKKWFGNGNFYTQFEAGDLFYIQKGTQYQFFKVLKVEEAATTLHVMVYEEQNHLPTRNQVAQMPIQLYHAPIDSNGFENPTLFEKTIVTDADLLGYHAYIKATHHVAEIVAYAKKYYQEAHQLSDAKQHETAIEKYQLAIHLMPNFVEAIDNMAFCYMDLGHWAAAIPIFEQSLQVNPNSLLAVFSIGECYLKQQNYVQAKQYFEKAIQINPNHGKPRQFLQIVLDAMNHQK
jgi:tetratricopeptide (TPR) repeat protein